MCQTPSLLLPYLSKPYEVETDASDYEVGTILYQDGKSVAFEGKKLAILNSRKKNDLLLYMHLSHGDITCMEIVLL